MHPPTQLAHALAAVATVSLLHAPPVHAVEATTRLAWRCTFEMDEAYNMACVPFAFAADGSDVTPDPLAPPVLAAPRRANFRAVSTRPIDEVFAVDVWRVPLFGPATDMDAVRDLLRGVLCGRHPDCSVHTEDLMRHAQAPVRRR